MAFPVHKVTRPGALAGRNNGKLPRSILAVTPGQAGGAPVSLVVPAARAWRALCAAGRAQGFLLKSGSSDCSYRAFDQQERLFTDRFTLHDTGRKSKHFRGQRWFLKPKVAEAATPGASNHGWGLAIDTEVEHGKDDSIADNRPALKWLVANEHRFGFSHELQSEPWHIRYFAGDAIPPAVLAFEKTGGDAAPPLTAADFEKAATHTWFRDSDPRKEVVEPAFVALHRTRRTLEQTLSEVEGLRRDFAAFTKRPALSEREIIDGVLARLSPAQLAEVVVQAVQPAAAGDAAATILNQLVGASVGPDGDPDEPDGD